MKVAVALGGTDLGRSGMGRYLRALLPEFRKVATLAGTELMALGTGKEFEVYADALAGYARCPAPRWVNSAAVGALWYLARSARMLDRAGANVILYPAANRRLPLLTGLPTVAVVHDLAQLRVPKKYDRLRMAYARFGMVQALKAQTRLVAVSSATGQDVASALKLPATAIEVIPNGVDAARFRPLRADAPEIAVARGRTGLDGPYLLYVSRLELPGKNHLRLLRAFARSHLRATHTLALAGDDWGARARIEAEVGSLGLARSLRFLGFVDDDVLPALVAGAEALAMVGLREGFGLPALEALAAGTPVFVSDAGGLPEVVDDLAALCDPLDQDSIQRAMERAATDAALRSRIRECGPKHARRRGWEGTASRLFSLCQGLGQSSKQPPC